MKETICTIAGIFGSFIAGLFGGWDTALATLLIFMAVDYVTGLIVAAAGKSPKGKLSSKIGWRGLAKKCVVLLLVLVAAVLMRSVLWIVTPSTLPVSCAVGMSIRLGLFFVSRYSLTVTPPSVVVLSGVKIAM